MLQFVIGTAGTGKSRYISDRIRALAEKGEKCIFIVPEQFSQSGESLVFSSLGEARLGSVRLFSFTSLVRDVRKTTGLIPQETLTAPGKVVLVSRACNNLKNVLKLYKPKPGDLSLSFSLTSLFDEFRRSGLDAPLLKILSEKPGRSEKLKELALIYSEYCGIPRTYGRDSEDILNSLAAILPRSYTRDTHIFIDGFESFSAGQLAVIGKFLRESPDVTIALVCDKLNDDTRGTGIFSYVQRTVSRLEKIARKQGVKISLPVVLSKRPRFLSPALNAVDRYLVLNEETKVTGKGRYINRFPSARREVYYSTALVSKLVREGLSYNDIAVVCPQLDGYEELIQNSFTRREIPYFIDQKRIISSCRPVALFKGVLDIMDIGPDPDIVIAIMKTGLTSFTQDETDLLENYLYTWREYHPSMVSPFVLPPEGLDERPRADSRSTLETLNGIREKFIGLTEPYIGNGERPLEDILRDCYSLVTVFGGEDKAMKVRSDMADPLQQELLVRQWETAVDCLDSLYSVAGKETMTRGEARQLFTLRVESTRIGFAPRTQDCVTVTDPKRMKLGEVKAVLILGASEDYFPRVVNQDRLISDRDRQLLKENGCPLRNDFENLMAFERLYFYKALTSPRQCLFISSRENLGREKQDMSSDAARLRERLDLDNYDLDFEDYAVTGRFFSDYCAFLADASNRQSYLNLLSDLGIETVLPRDRLFRVEDTRLIEKTVGDNIVISPTAAEKWYKCAFMYFMENILKVTRWKKAEMSGRIAGDYIHDVARQVLSRYGANYGTTSWEEIRHEVDRRVDRYISSTYPPRVREDPSFAARHRNMRENARRFMKHIHSEQQASLFRPVAYEQKFGKGGIAPLTIDLDEEKKITVRGTCDRVDIYKGKRRDYLRIIDYKSGKQEFKLDDIYNGLSSQMLLYMEAARKSGAFESPDRPLKPGAVVYQSADRRFRFDKDESENLYPAKGMALRDREIATAFDREDRGRFGVYKENYAVKKKDEEGSVTVSEEKFDRITRWSQEKIKEMARDIFQGKFDDLPLELSGGNLPCEYCLFSGVCQNRTRYRQMEKNDFDSRKEEK